MWLRLILIIRISVGYGELMWPIMIRIFSVLARSGATK